jgi:hypothetical protein
MVKPCGISIIRGKYDKIDAIRIGKYAVKNFNELHLWVERRPVLEQLATLNSLKSRLLGLQVALEKTLNEQKTFAKKGIYNLNIASCANTLTASAF